MTNRWSSGMRLSRFSSGIIDSWSEKGPFHSPYPTQNKNHFNKEISLRNTREKKSQQQNASLCWVQVQCIHSLSLLCVKRAIWQTGHTGQPATVALIRCNVCSHCVQYAPSLENSQDPMSLQQHLHWTIPAFLKTQVVPSKGTLGQWRSSFSCTPYLVLPFYVESRILCLLFNLAHYLLTFLWPWTILEAPPFFQKPSLSSKNLTAWGCIIWMGTEPMPPDLLF